jgi:hypothetical protein
MKSNERVVAPVNTLRQTSGRRKHPSPGWVLNFTTERIKFRIPCLRFCVHTNVNLRLSVDLRLGRSNPYVQDSFESRFSFPSKTIPPTVPAVQHDILEDILRPTLLSGQDIRALL